MICRSNSNLLVLEFSESLNRPGYRLTKGLTQNLNLRTHLKLEYNIKSLNYMQHNFRFQASFLYYWTMSFTFLHDQWFKSYYNKK